MTQENLFSLYRAHESATLQTHDDERLRASTMPLLQSLEQATSQLDKTVDRLVCALISLT